MKDITKYKSRAAFNRGISYLLFYRTKYGNIDVPDDYVACDNFKLGEWIEGIRCLYVENQLTAGEIKRLEALGFSFVPNNQNWESMFALLKEYFIENGNLNVPLKYKTDDGKLLGAWVHRQFRDIRSLSESQRLRIELITRTGGAT